MASREKRGVSNVVRMWGGAVVALLIAGGCSLMDASWTNSQKDVREAKKGWTLSQVQTKIGKPSYKEVYGGLRSGWEEWVYPTGSIFFYRMVAKEIVPRDENSPMPERRKTTRWPVEVGDDPEDMEPRGFSEF